MTIDDIVVANDRDARVLAWLRTQFTDAEIEAAMTCLAGARRPYVSNVCKLIGIVPPDDVVRTPPVQAREHLAAAKALLASKLHGGA